MLCCGSNSSHINPYQVALMYKHFKVNGKNDLNCQWFTIQFWVSLLLICRNFFSYSNCMKVINELTSKVHTLIWAMCIDVHSYIYVWKCIFVYMRNYIYTHTQYVYTYIDIDILVHRNISLHVCAYAKNASL